MKSAIKHIRAPRSSKLYANTNIHGLINIQIQTHIGCFSIVLIFGIVLIFSIVLIFQIIVILYKDLYVLGRVNIYIYV